MKEQIVLDGLLVNYYEFQSKGDKTLLFLHGWRSDGKVWSKVAENLKNKGVKIFALDLPGFGDSVLPPKAFFVDDYAKIVIDFITKMKLKKVTLVGHSFGGRIAIKLSSAHPEYVDRIVLVDSAAFVSNSFKKKYRKIIAKIMRPLFSLSFMSGIRTNIYKRMGAEDYVATPELKDTFLNLVNEDLTHCLSKITLPTLIYWGDRDEETPLSFSEIMQKEILNSKRIIVPNAGHFSFLDDPDRFCDELIKFIEQDK